ncbi:hypothetical protein ACP4OV_014004 [Aristida adscensionis]
MPAAKQKGRKRRILGDFSSPVVLNSYRKFQQSKGINGSITRKNAQPNIINGPMARKNAVVAAARQGTDAGGIGSGESRKTTAAGTDAARSLIKMAIMVLKEIGRYELDATAAAARFENFRKETQEMNRSLDSRMLEQLVSENRRLMIEKSQKEAEVQEVKAEKEVEIRLVKAQKEAEMQKVMKENVMLHAMVDKKEAQLAAMSEQCKIMALNHPN